jgi:hypothetical protein
MVKKIYSVVMIHESYVENHTSFTSLVKAKAYFRKSLQMVESYLTKKELVEATKNELYFNKDTNIQIIQSVVN